MTIKKRDVLKTPSDKVMTVEELSQYLHIHRSTVYRLLKRGEIPAFSIGSDWPFNRASGGLAELAEVGRAEVRQLHDVANNPRCTPPDWVPGRRQAGSPAPGGPAGRRQTPRPGGCDESWSDPRYQQSARQLTQQMGEE